MGRSGGSRGGLFAFQLEGIFMSRRVGVACFDFLALWFASICTVDRPQKKKYTAPPPQTSHPARVDGRLSAPLQPRQREERIFQSRGGRCLFDSWGHNGFENLTVGGAGADGCNVLGTPLIGGKYTVRCSVVKDITICRECALVSIDKCLNNPSLEAQL